MRGTGLRDGNGMNQAESPRPRRPDQLLAPPELDRVGGLARLGAAWLLIQMFSGQLIGVASTAILSRLLLPGDYGIMGMVATLTALLMSVSSMGLSWSTVQRRDLTMVQVNNLFWVNTAAGFALWGVAIAVAPALAAFYGEPAVADVTRTLGATFAISGLAVQPNALMHRAMQFRPDSSIGIAAQLVGASVAVAAAASGWGYWALVASGLVSQSVRTVLVFVVSGYRPGLPQRDPATRSMLSFGGLLTLSSIIAYLLVNFDNIVVGRVWGAVELGYYSRAYFLLTLPTMVFTTSLERVMVPSLSALASDRERMGAAYRSAIRAISFGGFPVAAGLAVTAPEAVRIVYGPGWEPVVPILAWFSVGMVTGLIGGTNHWLYTAVGRARTLLWLNLARFMVKVLVVLIGAQFGPVGVAAGLSISGAIQFVPILKLAHHQAGIPLRKTLQSIGPAFACAVVMGGAALGAGLIADLWWENVVGLAAVKVSIGAVVYGGLALFWLAPWPLPVAERTRLRLLRQIGISRSG